jgi:hypothetical protein
VEQMALQTDSDSEQPVNKSLLERVESWTDYPLLILSLLLIPLLIGPLLYDMDSDTERVYFILDGVIWVFFALDFLVKLAIA